MVSKTNKLKAVRSRKAMRAGHKRKARINTMGSTLSREDLFRVQEPTKED